MTYLSSVQCSRKRVQQLKKCTKVMFLDFEKKKHKNVKTYVRSFKDHLITAGVNTQ